MGGKGPPSPSNKYLGGISVVFDVLVDRVLGKKTSVAGHLLTNNSVVIEYFYRQTMYFLFIIYSLNVYNGFNEKVINCYSGYDSKEPTADIYYYCLAYPFVISNKEKIYILFYKWVPWILLVCGIMFYIPKSLVKSTSCKHISNFLSKVESNHITVPDIISFLNKNWDKFTYIYTYTILCHVFALAINASVFFMLDFCLQGRFFSYVPRAYPFHRTPFSDDMTATFPPFVMCNVTTEVYFRRTEIFKCHLFLMDYYEKIFIGLWLWIVFLTIITILYILFMVSFNFYCVKICIHKNETRVGNIFVLYKLKSLLTTRQYEDVLSSIETKHNRFSQCKIGNIQ